MTDEAKLLEETSGVAMDAHRNHEEGTKGAEENENRYIDVMDS